MKIDQVIEEFKKYLEENTIILPPDDNQIDLYSFFKSLTELKTYTNRNAKHIQTAIVSFQEALIAINKQIKLQDVRWKSLLTYQDNEIATVTNEFSLELINYRDSILRNSLEAEDLAQKLNNFWTSFSAKKKALGLADGLKFTLAKIDGELHKNGIEKIKAIGRTFDPAKMKIISVTNNKKTENLIVVDEAVSGFYNNKNCRLIRYAEVIVNKVE